MRRLCVLLASALVSVSISAKDLGTFGEVYEVVEQDLLQRMAYEASGSVLRERLEERQEEAKKWFNNAPRKVNVGRSVNGNVYFIKHELIVTSDFEVPVLVDKQTGVVVQTPTKNISNYRVEYRYLARKGDRKSVTDSPGYSMPERFLVFNPDDDDQMAFVMKAAETDKNLTLVTTHGDILGLSEETGRPVHLLFPSLKDIFLFERTPAFMGLTHHNSEKVLFTIELSLDQLEPKKALKFISSNWSGPSNVPEDVQVKRVVKEIDPTALMRQFGGGR
jgi:hypothetical protein